MNGLMKDKTHIWLMLDYSFMYLSLYVYVLCLYCIILSGKIFLFYILKEYTYKSKCNLRLATAFDNLQTNIDDEL